MGILLTALVGLMAVAGPARAQEADNGTTVQQIIDLLEQKGIISHQEAENMKQRPAAAGPSGDKQSDVQRLEEKLDRQMDHVQTKVRLNERSIERLETQRVDKLADENQKSSWAQRISFDGDIRLRYEGIYYEEDNYPDIGSTSDPDLNVNTLIDRERLRARVRLGMKAKLVDPRDVNVGRVEAIFRLSTGSSDDPVSTNETLGDYFNKDNILLDRYYLQWTYKPLLPVWGRIPQVSLMGGRMPNPWFSSDLVWDDDLNFEGLAFNFRSDTLDENGWYLFLTGGAFPLQEIDFTQDDKWLYAGQIGLSARPFYGLKITLGAAYYDYQNIVGQPDDDSSDPGYITPGVANYTIPPYLQKGNTLMYLSSDGSTLGLVADYKIVDITTEVDFDYFFPVHIILSGTYATNIGFNQDEVNERAQQEVPEETEAYRLGLKIGYPKIFNFAEWNLFYEYKYIEKDAVLDAFNDSDFHSGGTNCQGWLAGFEFGLYRDVWLRVRWITTDEISDVPWAIDTLQCDVNARF